MDEDLPNDNQHDFQPGIMLIDDDGDGSIDEGSGWAEDDEDGLNNEDPLDGVDNDGDGSIDEDAPSDNNGDGCPGGRTRGRSNSWRSGYPPSQCLRLRELR